jgi:putative two-component system response regulator
VVRESTSQPKNDHLPGGETPTRRREGSIALLEADGTAVESAPVERPFLDLDRGSNRILVVDDEEAIRRMVPRILKRQGFECDSASSAEGALEKLTAGDFAMVLTDMNMPGGSGLDLIDTIQKLYPDIATVMLTGVDETALADRALTMGAYGYLIKPTKANELVIAVVNALRRRTLEIENRSHRERLEEMVKERTRALWEAIHDLERAQQDLRSSQEETIRRLSLAAEYRDDETSRHLHRMSRYCSLIAEAATLGHEQAELIRIASIMHDVGKIGIPDSILLKPGKLTGEERAVMIQHAEMGHQILAGSKSELLQVAATIALTHHERYDGGGYPRGLKDEEIPIEGRIAAIADVFDALTSDRVYRKAFPWPRALTMMRDERGKHFDPVLLDLLFDNIEKVIQIKEDMDEAQEVTP